MFRFSNSNLAHLMSHFLFKKVNFHFKVTGWKFWPEFVGSTQKTSADTYFPSSSKHTGQNPKSEIQVRPFLSLLLFFLKKINCMAFLQLDSCLQFIISFFNEIIYLTFVQTILMIDSLFRKRSERRWESLLLANTLQSKTTIRWYFKLKIF